MVPGGWGASIPARCRQLNGRPRPDLDKEIREIADSIADAEFGRQKTGDVLRIVFFNICDSEEHARGRRTPGISALERNARMGSYPGAQ